MSRNLPRNSEIKEQNLEMDYDKRIDLRLTPPIMKEPQ